MMQGPNRRLCTIRRIDLPQDALEMHLHGSFGDGQLIGNYLIRGTLDQAAEDLQFAAGQLILVQ